jgi:hypothetical protein
VLYRHCIVIARRADFEYGLPAALAHGLLIMCMRTRRTAPLLPAVLLLAVRRHGA